MNPKIVKSLPIIQTAKPTYSAISRLDGKGTWEFLMQPTEMTYDRGNNYASASSVGGAEQFYQWQGNDNSVLTLTLPINGRSIRGGNSDPTQRRQAREIEAYVKQLEALLEPTEKGKAPPVLAFVWGQRSHSPCVLSGRFQRVETDWYPNGSLAACTVSFSLLKLSLDQLIK